MTAQAGIYIHVPFCAQKCPYCDFYSCRYTKPQADAYTAAVCRNLAALPQGLSVDSVYFGGGTPSLLPPDAIGCMLRGIRQRCSLDADAEITLEANPRTVTEERLDAWLETGVNRLSIGVQSFQDAVLQALGRQHTAEQGRAAILRAHAAGFRNLSVDLMIGLEMQDAGAVQRDLETAAALPVTHISAYMLKIEPGTPFGMQPPVVLDEDQTADRYLQMHGFLTAQGFAHYEISNFAKSGFESRHNCKYWRCAPYYGIGPAAHSCYGGVRRAVPRDLQAFCDAPLQPETVTEPHAHTEAERIMLGLRLAEGIAFAEIPQSRERLLHNAKPLMPRLVYAADDRIALTAEGWLVSNAVLVHLLGEIICNKP